MSKQNTEFTNKVSSFITGQSIPTLVVPGRVLDDDDAVTVAVGLVVGSVT
jgi:hypothetical protein